MNISVDLLFYSIEEILADSDSDDMCNEDDIRKTKGQNNKKNKGKEKSLIRETEDSIIDLIDANAASKILCKLILPIINTFDKENNSE